MNKALLPSLALLAVCAASVFAGGKKDVASEAGSREIQQNIEAAKGELDRQGRSIAVLKPQSENLDTGDTWLPSYVQGILIDNFSKYSGMNVPDRQHIDTIIEEGETGYYGNEEELLRAGKTVNVTYFLAGTLIKVSTTEYSLQLAVSDAVTGNRAASSTKNAAPAQLRDGAALNLATADLLKGLGVRLTPDAEKALAQPLSIQTAESQVALAKSNAAATEFERIQYAYEAAAIDPNLKEASQRLSTYQEAMFEIPAFTVPAFAAPTFTLPEIKPVSTGNIGADARDELARYRANKAAIEEQQRNLLLQRQDILDQWQDFLRRLDDQRQPLRSQEQQLFQRQQELVAMLREAEAFYTEHPPFRIFYDPEVERRGINYENATTTLLFEIASEPISVDALKDVLNALRNLNKSFTAVNQAYEDVNTVIAARFNQVEAAMSAVSAALSTVNSAGMQYDVAAVSADWTVPPGTTVDGTALRTDWPTDYLRTFTVAVSLLDDTGTVIGRSEVSLTNNISWNGPLKPETAFAWCAFDNVKIDDITDTLTVRIDRVNDRDVTSAAATGYIAIAADGARTVAIGKRTGARESWRKYWSDTNRLNSFGAAIGTTGGIVTPAFLVSAKITFSPFSYSFFEAGSDFGLVPGEWDIQGIEYLSIAPYLHFNLFIGEAQGGVYAGIGGGASFSRYTYPSESQLDPVTMNTWVVDANAGLLLGFSHSFIDLRWTIKTNFKGIDNRFTLGYTYRFGYLAPRFGGDPANLTNRR
jgi:hypothetical protein